MKFNKSTENKISLMYAYLCVDGNRNGKKNSVNKIMTIKIYSQIYINPPFLRDMHRCDIYVIKTFFLRHG